MGDRAAKTALFDEFARVGRALASGRRIELLDVLANGERSVEALAGEAGLSVANTSQHLQVLRQAGLVTARRQGTSVHYRLAGPEVFELWQALRTLASARLAELPGDREIVAYCRGPYCAFAHDAVALLREAGFQARRLVDGLPEWQAAGLAVTRT